MQCLYYLFFFLICQSLADKFQEDAIEGIIPIFPLAPYYADDLRRIADNTYDKTPDMILRQGYRVETHQVTTEDSYILEMHRMPPKSEKYKFDLGYDTEKSLKGSVIFLMHGLSGSSADWILSGPQTGLGYILSSNEADVWMGNARGNVYSRKHASTETENNKDKYWDFTFHEMGIYDLPAMIDYILKVTGKEKIFFIGHSLGATAFFVMCSEKPQYNNKIEFMFAMSPITTMTSVKSPYLHTIRQNWRNAINFLGRYDFAPDAQTIRDTKFQSNQIEDVSNYLIENLLESSYFLTTGVKKTNIDYKTFPIVVGHTLAGTSAKVFLHLIQIMDAGNFVKYNYGLFHNLLKYFWPWPPAYKLKKTTVPVVLLYSRSDWLSSEEDIQMLYSKITNPIGKYLIREKKFGTNEFLWGVSTKETINDKLIRLLYVFGS